MAVVVEPLRDEQEISHGSKLPHDTLAVRQHLGHNRARCRPANDFGVGAFLGTQTGAPIAHMYFRMYMNACRRFNTEDTRVQAAVGARS